MGPGPEGHLGWTAGESGVRVSSLVFPWKEESLLFVLEER